MLIKVGDKVKYINQIWVCRSVDIGGFYFDWIAELTNENDQIITIDDTCEIEIIN